MILEENVELKGFTTFKIGGPARYFFRAYTVDDVRTAVVFAREKGVSMFLLGAGSNLLVSDEGFSGLVVKNEITGRLFVPAGPDTVDVSVGAGEAWDDFVADCVARGLYGLENLSGIPGTVGAAPVQNIGAYGVEAKDSIISVEVFDTVTESLRVLAPAECGFAYRDSFFKTPEGKKLVITKVTFRLHTTGTLLLEYKDIKNYFTDRPVATLASVRQAVLEIRGRKFPDLKVVGTAGSFFKNPIISSGEFTELQKKFPTLPGFPTTDGRVKTSLAWILDNVLHIKGFTEGAVGLYEAQPLVLVNIGGARAGDVERLAASVSQKVFDATGIKIEPEVEYVAGGTH